MTSAYILVLAIVVLGGLIAAVGDRIGSRIGKKRMRLFNLRPKQTATLMTIVTGILIAGSTLIVLFASSKSLRQGVFELDRLLNERRAAIKDLERQVRKTTEQKNQVEKALKTAKSEQIAVQKRLEVLNKNYQASRQRLRLVSGQLEKFRKEVANSPKVAPRPPTRLWIATSKIFPHRQKLIPLVSISYSVLPSA